MSAKISSPKLELTVLRALTHKDLSIAGTVLGTIDESFFDNEESVEIYSAVKAAIAESGKPPTYKLLLQDPSISVDAREFLRNSEATIQSVEDVKRAVDSLGEYRRRRILYELAAKIDKELQATKCDGRKLLQEVSTTLAGAQLTKATQDNFLHFGTNNNSMKFVESLIYEDAKEDVIPTGIEDFDRESGGFMRGSLVTIGASSGGGKCGILDTRVQLSTLQIVLEDGTVDMELEPEDLQRLGAAYSSSAQVRVKTKSFREMREEARAAMPHLDVDADSGELKGIVLPYKARVRTSQGIKESDYLFLSREKTIKVSFADGSFFQGTPSHKLCTSVASDTWIKLADAYPGCTVAKDTDELVSIVAIEDCGDEAVADICVPGPHNYLLENGVVSHNSLVAGVAMPIAQALLGYKVDVVPLEMSKREMTARFMANLSGVDVTRILQSRLADGEKDKVFRIYKRTMKRIKEAGGRLTIFKPQSDVDIQEVLAALNALGGDVRYIDYLNLLKGAEGDDSWRKLMDMARYAKINAESTNAVNVILVQVNEEGKIRYSRGVSEHSTNSLVWTAKPEERAKEIGRIQIEQPKSRNSAAFPIEIGLHWKYMRVVKLEDAAEVPDTNDTPANLAADV